MSTQKNISTNDLTSQNENLNGTTWDYKNIINKSKQRCALDRLCCGVIGNETKYNDYNILPLPDNYNPNYNFEYGYSYLPPDKWFPTPPTPPICVTSNRCQTCPNPTLGNSANLKEWDNALRITQPDNINIDYINEKLNAGR